MITGEYSEEELAILKKYSYELTYKELATILNRKPASVNYKLKYNNLRPPLGISKANSRRVRGIFYKEDFFAVPNILNSYWAGFLAADGNISYCGGKRRLQVQLSVSDLEHLEKLKSDLEFTGKTTHYIATKNFTYLNRKNQTDRQFELVSTTICSDKLCNDLWEVFNIGPKKTLTLEPPKLIEKEHIYAYIIGFIDGDGSIVTPKDKTFPYIHFMGTIPILNWIAKELNEIITPYTYNLCEYTYFNKSKTYTMRMGNKKVTHILRYFKTLPVPKLARKWDKVIGTNV